MPENSLNLAVLEGKWSSKTNISVKSLFDLLSDIRHQTPHAYRYEMFCDGRSLESIVKKLGAMRRRRDEVNVKYIYIGAHGSPKGLETSGERITRRRLQIILQKLSANRIDGLFIGSCLFSETNNANYLLSPQGVQNPKIMWLAGYTTEVDWIDSSALDMLFWNKFFSSNETNALRKINYVANELKKLAPSLVAELGFRIYQRRRGNQGGVINLMEQSPPAVD